MKEPYVKQFGTLDGFKIMMVDDAYIHDHIDVDFTFADQHWHLKFIPKDEIWIDSASKEPEITWWAKAMIKEARLMQSGDTYNQAAVKAGPAEDKERKHDPDLHARVKIAKLGSNGKLSVFLVKGEVVRDKFFKYYTEGGHGLVYRWIPKTEIWLDDSTSAKDRPYNFLHEIFERNLMAKGVKYEKAHHAALAEELKARRDPKRYKALLEAEEKKAGGDLGLEKIADFRALLRA